MLLTTLLCCLSKYTSKKAAVWSSTSCFHTQGIGIHSQTCSPCQRISYHLHNSPPSQRLPHPSWKFPTKVHQAQKHLNNILHIPFPYLQAQWSQALGQRKRHKSWTYVNLNDKQGFPTLIRAVLTGTSEPPSTVPATNCHLFPGLAGTSVPQKLPPTLTFPRDKEECTWARAGQWLLNLLNME